jgi:serine protease Do
MKKVWQLFGILAVLLSVAALVADTGSSSPASTIPVDELKEYESQVEHLVKRALPCTVCVRAVDGRGSGSGVVIGNGGLVLTAAHVMIAAGEDLMVVFPNGTEVRAKPLGANLNRDAGMIQILGETDFAGVELGESAPLKRNEWCVALGHAGGFDPRRTPPVRLGRILENARFLTTDSALISGDSGGPLFDIEGQLIGIHSNIGASLSENNHVPIDVFKRDWDRLLRGETWGRLPGTPMDPNRAVLGIQFSLEGNDDPRVVGIFPDSPADKAGLEPGDIVQQVEGQDVNSAQEVIDQVSQMAASETVSLKVQRGAESLELRANLVRVRDLPRVPPRMEEKATDPRSDELPKRRGRRSPAGEADQPAEQNDDARELDLEQLLREARENGGRLRLTREQLRELQREMAKQMARPATESEGDREAREWGERVFASFEPIVASARRGVFQVMVAEQPVALATAVGENRLVTKASEVDGNDFRVILPNGRELRADVEKIFAEYDLALLRVPGGKFEPVSFAPKPELREGKFVAVVGGGPQPEAIGVVSVLARSLDAASQGFLGVVPEPAEEGVRLALIQSGTPAAQAGLQPGDLVLLLDGTKYRSPAAFAREISRHGPGEQITLRIRRNGREMALQVQLGDRASLAPMPGRMGVMDQLAGRLSKRRDGFRTALQHDCPLDPEDCGGPLVDLDGQVIGINIARAGRIKSYAVPAATVQELLDR